MIFFQDLDAILQQAENILSQPKIHQKRSTVKKKQQRFNKKVKQKYQHLLFAICPYCHYAFLLDDLTVEHKIPLCLGGLNEVDNLTLACYSCNNQKGKFEGSLFRSLKRKIRRNNSVFY